MNRFWYQTKAGYAGFKMVVIIQIVGMKNQHSFIVLEQLIVIGASFLGPKLCVTLGQFSNWCLHLALLLVKPFNMLSWGRIWFGTQTVFRWILFKSICYLLSWSGCWHHCVSIFYSAGVIFFKKHKYYVRVNNKIFQRNNNDNTSFSIKERKSWY